MTTVNNVENLESTFYRNLGDGVKACAALAGMIESVVTSRDTTVLTKAMRRAVEDKQDEQAARAVALVASQVWPKAKIGKTKDGVMTIRIKGIQACDDALARLRNAVDRDLSIRHSTFRKTIKPVYQEQDSPELALSKKVTGLVKWCDKTEGVTIDALIAALQAAR